MKTEHIPKPIKTKSLAALNAGECFKYRDNIYIKSSVVPTQVQVIDLHTGLLTYLPDAIEVVTINAELVWSYKQ